MTVYSQIQKHLSLQTIYLEQVCVIVVMHAWLLKEK